jgi:hypothetical protein
MRMERRPTISVRSTGEQERQVKGRRQFAKLVKLLFVQRRTFPGPWRDLRKMIGSVRSSTRMITVRSCAYRYRCTLCVSSKEGRVVVEPNEGEVGRY